jgi:ABC-2 type transport system ATP-binding protein
MAGTSVISVRNVSRSFGKTTVLRGASLEVPAGQIVGLLGPSGAGKTTLVRLIAGTDRADTGQVEVDGVPMPRLDVLDRIGYMAQADALYGELTARQNMRFFGALFRLGGQRLADRIAAAAAVVGLDGHLDRPVHQYSGGMKRRVSLAIALLHEPKILILDEPTVGIDPVLRRQVWGRLRDRADAGSAILVTTHVMDEADRCDRVCMLRDGRIIAADTPDRLKQAAAVTTMEDAFLHYGAAP